MAIKNRDRTRRGVLLLIILALLAMFGVVAITFVLIAGHGRSGAIAARQYVEDTERPHKDLHEAALQVLRGSRRSNSVLAPHSLLEDVYGTASVSGTMLDERPLNDPNKTRVVAPAAGGQLIRFTADVDQPARRVGCVLTMLDGLAAGRSTRIVGYDLQNNELQIAAFPDVSTADFVLDAAPKSPSDPGRRYLVNAPAFSGTGFGFDPQLPAQLGPQLTYADSFGLPFALRPNPTAPTFFTNGAVHLEFAEYLAENALLGPDGIAGTADDKPANIAALLAANEDYDAPDYQNMLLARLEPQGDGTALARIPSLHRPSLLRYWISVVDPNAQFNDPRQFSQLLAKLPPETLRKIVLRPLRIDHPDFTGSNPAWDPGLGDRSGFNPLWNLEPPVAGQYNYSWDVDNDGDGIPDSIWVDLGFPVRSTTDGRRYKPLFAILCTDLDGRLNLNAHGCLTQADSRYYGNVKVAEGTPGNFEADGYYAPFTQGDDPFFFAGDTNEALLRRGQGYGPAEINLGPLFPGGSPTDFTRYRQFLLARYGQDGRPGAVYSDPLSQNQHFTYWNDCVRAPEFFNLTPDPAGWRYCYWKFLYSGTAYVMNAFGTPSGIRGDAAIGLDTGGRPIYCRMGEDAKNGVDQFFDNPYETNLAERKPSDNLFAPVELERILRAYDLDASLLPGRLAAFDLTNFRHEVTTESWDIPVPGAMLSQRLRASMEQSWATLSDNLKASLEQALLPETSAQLQDGTHRLAVCSVLDLLIVRLAEGLKNANVPDAQIPDRIAIMLPRLVPVELLSGRKMNLNRPFGNGYDDNGNGAVDEPARIVRKAGGQAGFQLDPNFPGEIILPPPKFRERVPQLDANGQWITDVPMEYCHRIDVNGDGTSDDVDRALARQLYARQLYVLAMLLLDHRVVNPGNPTTDEANRARLVAQWAVNVVDFRDRDAIMTPFEYDVDPFDGWDVDGIIDDEPPPPQSDDTQPYRGFVWGCERPELLITETLAFHDRRTQNLEDDGGKYHPDHQQNEDDHEDFDQKLRPEGSLFVEIYNPTNRLNPNSLEFYEGAGDRRGVDLSKMAPGNSPVWRLAIYENASDDPDDPSNAPERSVYFVNAAGIPVNQDGHRHFPEEAPNMPVAPGRYAVIGPGNPSKEAWAETTFIGFRRNKEAGDDRTRRIVLNPQANIDLTPPANDPSRHSVAVLFNQKVGTNDLPFDQIQQPVAVVVNRMISKGQPRYGRLSVSEPFDGYPTADPDGNVYDSQNQCYTTPFPSPLDAAADADFYNAVLVKNGMHLRFRFVHLQRLANPTLPWHPKSNPYRTIDTAIIDLVTFNGVRTHSQVPEPLEEDIDPDNFYTRERGEHNGSEYPSNDPNYNYANSLWTQEPIEDSTAEPLPNGKDFSVNNHEYSEGLHHTLGFLNYDLNKPFSDQGPRDATLDEVCKGDPRGIAFPWLTWPNRPFVSQLELLLVPAVSARQLLMHPTDLQADPATYPFAKRFGLAPSTSNPYEENDEPFPHLMNLFQSLTIADYQGGVANPNDVFELHQLLDLVGVPSRFVGTEIQGNPRVFAQYDPGNDPGTRHNFPPPANGLPTYREPGRINLNTIASQRVFRGLLNWPDLSNGGSLEVNYHGTLRGYTSVTDSTVINPLTPTRIENPFRSAAGLYLTPALANNPTDPDKLREINTGLLRSAPQANDPLFQFNSANHATHTNRNPYFRYQELQRLANLTTTRSNVYAVWITVGYFEVHPRPNRNNADGNPWTAAQYAAVYPDGYALGEELGSDRGEVQRHRAFYIIDRSIPVGFQRGEDLNVEKCILLHRYIE